MATTAQHTPTSAAAPAEPLVMVVMDPLAKELSCPCVQGYAQRDYQQLADFLTRRLGRTVEVVCCESLVTALADRTGGRADIVIGKQSVVEFDARRAKRKLRRLALLAGKDGLTTQTGLFVVASDDPATTMSGLQGYRLIFGPADCDEKHAAALALCKAHGVEVPQQLETATACDEGATIVLELPAGQHGAAVISSYARPLLEGCGTVPQGALRVVGETAPVPFIAAYVSADLPDETQQSLRAALSAVAGDAPLCVAMETAGGFVPTAAADGAETSSAKKKN